jgi:outer membrane protein assembly factor BamD (BamD/ComL family)
MQITNYSIFSQSTKAYRRMDTEKARDKLEEIKDRYQLGGDLEKVKVIIVT